MVSREDTVSATRSSAAEVGRDLLFILFLLLFDAVAIDCLVEFILF